MICYTNTEMVAVAVVSLLLLTAVLLISICIGYGISREREKQRYVDMHIDRLYVVPFARMISIHRGKFMDFGQENSHVDKVYCSSGNFHTGYFNNLVSLIHIQLMQLLIKLV